MALDINQKASSELLGSGEPCEYGCNELQLDELIEYALRHYKGKMVCALKDWSWWDYELDEKGHSVYWDAKIIPCVIYSTNVVWSNDPQWQSGNQVKTRPLMSFDDDCFFLTATTVYILVGRGTRKSVDFGAMNRVVLSLH